MTLGVVSFRQGCVQGRITPLKTEVSRTNLPVPEEVLELLRQWCSVSIHRAPGAETAQPPEANRRAQQRRFDPFRSEYNEVRPHEALDQKTPASRYQGSPRCYPERVPEPEYPDGMQVRRVMRHGGFYWKHQEVFLTEVLGGESIDWRRWTIATGWSTSPPFP